jgi:2,4-dienoyl-CoA reductase-like NADH-dependent reductase (Old Yellow Enzyme family)
MLYNKSNLLGPGSNVAHRTNSIRGGNVSRLFEKTTINGMGLSNRFVRSATWEGMAGEDGSCTPALIDVAVQLARGGVGLIITGHAFVRDDGRAGPWQMAIYDDKFLPGLIAMTDAVHGEGGHIVAQITHAGCRAAARLSGLQAIGPSPLDSDPSVTCKEMTHADIEEISDSFARAAVRAREARFDGVQIHAAHGYLVSQFLSPFFNKRKDGYGGGIENRTRMVLEVLRAVRKGVGEDYPVLMKINSEDFVEDGFTVNDMVEASMLLEQAGIDAIEMSGGNAYSGDYLPSRKRKPGTEEEEVYYREAARYFKEKVRLPLMLVGGIRSYDVAEQLISEGLADYIAMCRPFIREPGLVNRWQSGDIRKAFCISDNGCFKPAFQGEGVRCTVEKR